MRVLCLDIEGGYGGSSRSLYYSLKHIDRSTVKPEVWCRQEGPAKALYAELGVECRVCPELTNAVPLTSNLKTLVDFSRSLANLFLERGFYRDLAQELDRRFDLIHFNHSGFFMLVSWLRSHTNVPFTMHYRRLFPETFLAKSQVSSLCRNLDHLIFITENEFKNFTMLGGESPHDIIHNIIEPMAQNVTAHPAIPDDDRFKIASLSNFALTRGTDRLIDVAVAIPPDLRHKFLFVVAGKMELSKSSDGKLGSIARRGGTLVDYARECGVEEMFQFLGHVSEPERVLQGCDMLIKPTRIDIPWGRDILEAMIAGIPVLTCGTWDKFVRHRETGLLHPNFDAEDFARELCKLSTDVNFRNMLGQAAQKHIRTLCNGPARAEDLSAVWKRTVRS